MRNFLGFAAGLVFGIGLIISGMTDPAKVLNFLDILGPWDPSLAFVMGGASVTAFIGYRLIWRRERPVMGSQFDLPDSTAIDAPLLTGAALVGMGWGLGGFCPGPAWTSLLIGSSGILIFLPAMLVGIVLAGFAKSSSSFASKGA
jgi:uncharacterized membrane protein YedE/YeeE